MSGAWHSIRAAIRSMNLPIVHCNRLTARNIRSKAPGGCAHPQEGIIGLFCVPGVAVIANGVILTLVNGDRGSTLIPGGGRGGRGGPGGPGSRGGGPRTIPLAEVNPADPGSERDAAWCASQLRPFRGRRTEAPSDTRAAATQPMPRCMRSIQRRATNSIQVAIPRIAGITTAE